MPTRVEEEVREKDYFNRTQKLVTVLIDAIVFVVGIFLSFWMRSEWSFRSEI